MLIRIIFDSLKEAKINSTMAKALRSCEKPKTTTIGLKSISRYQGPEFAQTTSEKEKTNKNEIQLKKVSGSTHPDRTKLSNR